MQKVKQEQQQQRDAEKLQNLQKKTLELSKNAKNFLNLESPLNFYTSGGLIRGLASSDRKKDRERELVSNIKIRRNIRMVFMKE